MGKQEDPVHLFAVEYIGRCHPKIVLHHSPSEGPAFANEGWRLKQYRLGMKGGWPDIEFVLNGRVGFIELKRPKSKGVSAGKLSDSQIETTGALREAGAFVAVCSTPEEVMTAVQRFVALVEATR